MTIDEIINELKALASEKTKRSYMLQGAKEPIFGMTIKSLKPTAKKLEKLENTQEIAYELYRTGNYDLMYLAGMIVDPNLISKEKYNEWIEAAYFHMISDYIVAVTLSEASIAEEVADQWINSSEDLKISAGYSTYSWMLSHLKDEVFDKEKLSIMLEDVKKNIGNASNRSKYSMAYFVYNVAVSYAPLSEKAILISEEIASVAIFNLEGKSRDYNANADILKQLGKGRLGFKRKNVRC